MKARVKKDPPEKTGGVRAVPQSVSGLMDGVELETSSTISVMVMDGEKVNGVAEPYLVPCKMLASYTTGVVSLSIKGSSPFVLSVRLDEMMALLHAAADRKVQFDQMSKKTPHDEQIHPEKEDAQ